VELVVIPDGKFPKPIAFKNPTVPIPESTKA